MEAREGRALIPDIVVTVFASIVSGTLGYTIAVVKRDTAIALLKQSETNINGRLDTVDDRLLEQNERMDRHLKMIFRLILDIARKSGVDIRTADAVEIATLTDGGQIG